MAGCSQKALAPNGLRNTNIFAPLSAKGLPEGSMLLRRSMKIREGKNVLGATRWSLSGTYHYVLSRSGRGTRVALAMSVLDARNRGHSRGVATWKLTFRPENWTYWIRNVRNGTKKLEFSRMLLSFIFTGNQTPKRHPRHWEEISFELIFLTRCQRPKAYSIRRWDYRRRWPFVSKHRK